MFVPKCYVHAARDVDPRRPNTMPEYIVSYPNGSTAERGNTEVTLLIQITDVTPVVDLIFAILLSLGLPSDNGQHEIAR